MVTAAPSDPGDPDENPAPSPIDPAEWERQIERMAALARAVLWDARKTSGDHDDAVMSAIRTHLRQQASGERPAPATTDELWALLKKDLYRKLDKYRLSRRVKKNQAVRESDVSGEAEGIRWQEAFFDKNQSPEQVADFVREALQILDRDLPEPEFRQIAELAVQGFTPAEIAAETGLSVSQIYRRLDEIRDRLRRRLDADARE